MKSTGLLCLVLQPTHRDTMTQFEIERRSCGQSMTNFRFFSCAGQNTFTCCQSFFDVPCKKLTKNGKNVQNQSSCGSVLGTALTD